MPPRMWDFFVITPFDASHIETVCCACRANIVSHSPYIYYVYIL